MENLKRNSIVESKLTGFYYHVNYVRGNIINLDEIGDRTLEEMKSDFNLIEL